MTHLYDLNTEYEEVILPLVNKLAAAAADLGIPLIVRAWPGLSDTGADHTALVNPNREIVHASFAAATVELRGESNAERVMGFIQMPSANYYKVAKEIREEGEGFSLEPVELAQEEEQTIAVPA